ncbi:P-loop containing nucleoside triphosphate hydrolase protein [Lophiotrema nucula]|uniref:RNA helicase n=1 Tax=Lophiotrema nucula TaxID=690887 RepID=A0A6A5ZM52_9PLEO|nr:P-loop containing nucleoside triphosphate hydrolase protein [Lophiotrema nucula]
MASRHADRSRADRGRYEPPPRRDDRRYARDRDDRYDDRYDARDRRHGRDDRDARRYDRRSRSPAPRDRSRERRDRGGDRRARDYGRDSRDYRRRDTSRDSRRSDDRRRRSPDSEAREKAAREQKEKEEEERKKEEEKAAKRKKLEAWKKKQLEKKQQVESPGAAASPTVTAPPTPAAVPSPTQQQVAKKETPPEQKPAFKLDDSAKSRPLQSAAGVGKPATSAHGPVLNPSGNVSSFGLKAKAATEETTAKNLLGEEAGTEKRKLRILPDAPRTETEEPAVEADNDVNSDDEDQLRARLEKRREGLADEDTRMEDAPSKPQEEQMEVVEEDVDPLDAFMQDLQPAPATNGPTRQGQVILADDNEPLMQAVADDDLLAIAAAKKKKKKEAPIPDQTKIEYEPFRRSFYTEPADIAALTEEEISDVRLELGGLKVKGVNVPRPALKFAQMGLNSATLNVFNLLGYETPTPIQAQGIPCVLAGHDVIGIAKTGSGKTLSFGIPLIRHILDQKPLGKADGPIALILAPTRELVAQIVQELKPFLRASNLKIAGVYGGAPISENINLIKRGGIHILVSSCGRLLDLLSANSGRVMNMRRVTFCCLDEADRMLDMGFEPQVSRILSYCRQDIQTVVTSATFPPKMEVLARKLLRHDPVQIIVGGRSVVAPEVDQIVRIVPPDGQKKFNELLLQLGKYLVDDDSAEALIFVEKQSTAEDLLGKLMSRSYPVSAIHGSLDQVDRHDAIMDFKNGVVPILIATGVAARGLDIKGLKVVLNWDPPSHLEEYVHRVGRTGRAGNKGTAVTFVESPGQERHAHHIVKALKQSGKEVPEDLNAMAQAFYQKVNAGQEKWYDAGFGGKGLDRLDAARALEKKREKLAHRIEGEAEESEEESVLPPAPVVKKTGEDTAASPTAATPAPAVDEPSYMRLLREGVVVTKTERPAPDQKSSKPLSVMERVRLAAGGVDNRLSKKGTIHAGQPIDNKGPDAGLYHSTIEINDFPQKARWGVTNRTNVARILEASGTSITSKGVFYPAGKTPNEGDQPKLYILVEGDTENQVRLAMSELQRLLKEGTQADAEAPARGATGRYNVL